MMNKFLSILGSFIVTFIIYNRLFKLRIPRELSHTDNLYVICLNIEILIISSTLLFANLYLYYKYFTGNTEQKPVHPIIQKLQQLYNNPKNPIHLWTNSLIAFDMMIKNQIPFYDEHKDYLMVFFTFIGKLFCKHSKTSIFCLLFIIILVQSIVLTSFFIDVIFFHKFYYFYKILWLLLIPVIISYLLYSLKIFVNTNLESLEEILCLKIIKTDDYDPNNPSSGFEPITLVQWRELSVSSKKGEFLCLNTFSDAYLLRNFNVDAKDLEAALQYCVDSLNEFYCIASFLDLYNLKKMALILPFNIIKYLVYTYCWAYILFLILYH